MTATDRKNLIEPPLSMRRVFAQRRFALRAAVRDSHRDLCSTHIQHDQLQVDFPAGCSSRLPYVDRARANVCLKASVVGGKDARLGALARLSQLWLS